MQLIMHVFLIHMNQHAGDKFSQVIPNSPNKADNLDNPNNSSNLNDPKRP